LSRGLLDLKSRSLRWSHPELTFPPGSRYFDRGMARRDNKIGHELLAALRVETSASGIQFSIR